MVEKIVAVTPRFIRYPRVGTRDPVCGLSRAQLHLLVKSGRVRSFSLKSPGKARGVRLIDTASLIAAIEATAA